MKSLKELKNKFKGKRIFVIGNGPSLLNTPLDKLQNEYSIAMNRISLIYEKTKWRPTFFLCTTVLIKKENWRKDIMTSIDLGIDSFVKDSFFPYMGNRKNIYYVHCAHSKDKACGTIDDWSNDISVRVSKFASSMFAALQIVFYLGFDEIYILGADLGFQDPFLMKIIKNSAILGRIANFIDPNLYEKYDPKSHFAPYYGIPGGNVSKINKNMIIAHQIAKKAAELQGKKIFNATIGGNLEVYPRVDFNEIIQ